jgi:Stage II sporulation protein E (SpoIIE)
MSSRLCLFLSVLLSISAADSSSVSKALAEPLDPQPAAKSTITPSPAMQLKLGRSAAQLYGPWKFMIGDSPVDPATGQPLWAEPNFDDSHWEDVDLTPGAGASQNPITGVTGYVPGWTARGHSGYWGYAWYRIRVRIDAEPGVGLSLAGPDQVDDAYQAFDNGVNIGHFGDFSERDPVVYYAQPAMFPLAQATGDSSGVSTRVIAFRIWMQPQTLFESGGVGGFESPPSIGESNTIALLNQSHKTESIQTYLWQPIEAVFLGSLGLLALSLAFFDRSDRVYLWIGGLFLMAAVDASSGALAVWTTWIPSRYDVFSHNFVLFACEYAGWVMTWRVWFRQRRPLWLPWALVPMVVLLIMSQALYENFFPAFAGTELTTVGYAVSLTVRLALAAFLLLIVVKAVREQGIEGWLALPPLLLASIAAFTHEISRLGGRVIWFPFGVQMNLEVGARLLLVAVLTILLVRRLVLSIRNQRLMALDVKQARELQRVILPEARTRIAGLEIECEYRPARQVGGDFFQIIPQSADGSVMIVAGDVAGKGLQAGMLVALLVGAIRSISETSTDPLEMLQALNRRLLGRNEANATCLALKISADGTAALANAGHLPPYLNGEPVAMEGALPLGVIESAEFSVTRLVLKQHDRIFIASDGLAEAMDAEGQLFGFTRVQELVKAGKSAAEVASVVQGFGQEDDISIITLTRASTVTA